MMRRPLAWIVALSAAACGSLAAHAAAYALTGTPSQGVHGYLEHAPQIVAVLATLALGGLALTGRAARLALWPFPALALAGFVAQEHVEALAHTGELPWLLTRPVFVVGLLLQVPFALAAWGLARLLLGAVAARRRPLPPRLPDVLLALRAATPCTVAAAPRRSPRVRAPPAAV